MYQVLVLLQFIALLILVYLVLHIAAARIIQNPESKVLAFFTILTGPAIGLVAKLVPPKTPPARLRWLTLLAVFIVWIVLRAVTTVPPPAG